MEFFDYICKHSFLMPQSQGMTSYEKNIIKYNKNTKQ